MNDIKSTLNLPKTTFPMKANLPVKEPIRLEKWIKQNWTFKFNSEKKTFVMHDGPPYANGKLHLGHVLNKTLKDIVVKAQILNGLNASFIPGWDCHGLPIELKVEQKLKDKSDSAKFRQECRNYANEQISVQKEDFVRLGIWADWEKPYATMAFKSEATIVSSLATMVEKGYIKKGNKPVYWCFDCQSSLADAEVEYQNKKSSSLYIKFGFKYAGYENISVLAWTTTPWSLPSNQAIAISDKIDYAIVKHASEHYVVAKDLIKILSEKFTIDLVFVADIKAKDLLKNLYSHPFAREDVPCLLGEHVTIDAGTGIVHTAPSHGLEDFNIWNKEVLSLIAADGRFTDETVKEIAGQKAFQATQSIIDYLKTNNKLFQQEVINHSYPHCWRHKTPVIYRATPQWFVDLNHNSLKQKSIEAAKKCKWIPSNGFERITSMIDGRNDWCISRQFRRWGVPMCFVLDKETHDMHPNQLEIMQKVSEKITQNGLQAWHDISLEELDVDSSKYYKSEDTLDVWFCSGVSHAYVLKENDISVADLYLEGSDQHRGWFQSSLLTSVAINDKAPFKTVLTHGFIVDKDGKKMSKSLGNIVEPQKLFKKYGADVIRLWIAATDYQKEVSISDEIMTRITDAYRRIRNTIRYLLANTADFDKSNALDTKDLLDIDKYILQKTANVQKSIIEYYENYDFHQVYHKILNFCVVDLGNFYLDVVKDRQYTMPKNSQARLSAQITMTHITNAMVRWIAPILSYTADEMLEHIEENQETKTSIFHKNWYELPSVETEFNWTELLKIKEQLYQVLENARIQGKLKSNLEANVLIDLPEQTYDELKNHENDLAALFIVSKVEVNLSDDEKVHFKISEAAGEKCPRCWMHVGVVSSGVCRRCDLNIKNTPISKVIA